MTKLSAWLFRWPVFIERRGREIWIHSTFGSFAEAQIHGAVWGMILGILASAATGGHF